MSSAHCLRFSPTWWDLYEVDPWTINYQITFQVSGPGIPQPYNLTMDQSTPFLRDLNNTISARIVGDLPTPTQNPSFEAAYLAIMRVPYDHPIARGGDQNWMIIPRDMVDLSGSTCNKIGVSFEGFYSQPQRCGVSAGTCLDNQLDDLYKADDAIRSANRTPTYLTSRWGKFVPNLDSTRYILSYLPKGIANTLISLAIKADAVRIITNRSTGKILEATVLDFTTFSRDGILYVTTSNSGALVAQYSLTVTECNTPGILPVPAQQTSLEPLESWATSFQLRAQNLFSSSDHCLVSYYDSSDELLDSVVVYFNTTMYKENRGSQGGNFTSTPNNFEFINGGKITCGQKCPGFWNIPCFVVTGCWLNVFAVLGVVVGAIVLLVALVKTRCCTRPVGACMKATSKEMRDLGEDDSDSESSSAQKIELEIASPAESPHGHIKKGSRKKNRNRGARNNRREPHAPGYINSISTIGSDFSDYHSAEMEHLNGGEYDDEEDEEEDSDEDGLNTGGYGDGSPGYLPPPQKLSEPPNENLQAIPTLKQRHKEALDLSDDERLLYVGPAIGNSDDSSSDTDEQENVQKSAHNISRVPDSQKIDTSSHRDIIRNNFSANSSVHQRSRQDFEADPVPLLAPPPAPPTAPKPKPKPLSSPKNRRTPGKNHGAKRTAQGANPNPPSPLIDMTPPSSPKTKPVSTSSPRSPTSAAVTWSSDLEDRTGTPAAFRNNFGPSDPFAYLADSPSTPTRSLLPRNEAGNLDLTPPRAPFISDIDSLPPTPTMPRNAADTAEPSSPTKLRNNNAIPGATAAHPEAPPDAPNKPKHLRAPTIPK